MRNILIIAAAVAVALFPGAVTAKPKRLVSESAQCKEYFAIKADPFRRAFNSEIIVHICETAKIKEAQEAEQVAAK